MASLQSVRCPWNTTTHSNYGGYDVAGIQQLVCFVKSGKIIELNEVEAAVDVSRRIPALLALPRALWESENLVLNGTASIVFKGTGDQILGLLQQIHRPMPHLITFQSSAKDLLEGNGSTFYLKLRLKETTLRQNPTSTVGVLLNNVKYRHSFLSVYPIPMYAVEPVGDRDCGLFLMNDCGIGLHQSEEFAMLTFPSFCACFATFRNDIMSMIDIFLHGDALPHNMVYSADSQKLLLIDIDEGTVGTSAHKRVVKDDDDHEYPYLRYPNMFRAWRNRQLYTEVQLTVSFLLLLEMFEDSMEENDKKLIGNLQKAVAAADSCLKKKNDKDPLAVYESSIDQSIRRLVELLGEILSSCPYFPLGTNRAIGHRIRHVDDDGQG